jgi:cytochrome P450
LEAQIAIASLIRRWPALRLADLNPNWRHTFLLRGLRRLPVTFATN